MHNYNPAFSIEKGEAGAAERAYLPSIIVRAGGPEDQEDDRVAN